MIGNTLLLIVIVNCYLLANYVSLSLLLNITVVTSIYANTHIHNCI